MFSMNQMKSAGFRMAKERAELMECIKRLIIDFDTPASTVEKFLRLAENESKILNRHDVLEDLCFANLLYG